MAYPGEKNPAPSAFTPYLDAVNGLFQPMTGPVMNTYNRFHGWKESMGLIQPGTVENLTREISQVHLANWAFEGARADVSKVVSGSPAFQLTHSFALGSSSKPSSYNFGAVFANAQTLLQGGVDGSGVVTMRANQTWSATDVTKVQGQLYNKPGQSMLQIEHDHLGPHYSLSLKTMNPGLLDGTGIHFVSLLHSISPRLSLGFESIIQHPQPAILETSTSYLAKLTSLPNPYAALAATSPTGQPLSAPFYPSWTATAQLQPSGNIQATYHQRLSEKVDVALDFQTLIQPASMMGPAKREAICTAGAKYDFRMATFRGQIDSNGTVGMLLEQRFTPAFAFMVSGEIDHSKNTSKFGVGIMIESSTMTQEEMIAAGMLTPVPGP
ncbi:putative mitochondrial import receptor subunit tom40 [Kockovaella imperatae]|uniref:Putative mitochondrial import receptor subunit tom40 n=1 Tax=Kockovaella imperatae TaxID=4999 RepID=A0A1Y1U5V3_9TREE|nr:putative mitochondrial import receptor subunit tom40 [Kockovaella imperatae]ORX33408.1 putative mitochondrial import receptor subunit tom40 [Kockovaella imperatae]